MIRKLLFLLIAVAATSIFVSDVLSQTQKKALTLPSGEVLCDLNSEWNATYEHYGSMQWIGNIKGMLALTQQGNTFVGKTTVDSAWSAKGTEKIQGELSKDGIKKARYSIPNMGWVDAEGEMSEDCNKMVFDTGVGVKVILDRK